MGFSLCTCSVATEEKREKRAEPWRLCSTVRVGTHSAVVTVVAAAVVVVITAAVVIVVAAAAAASSSPLLLLSSLLLLLLLPLLLLPLSLLLPLLLLLPLSSPSPSGEVAHLVARLPTPPLGSYHRCWGGRQPGCHLIRWHWAQGWSVGWDGMRDWGKRATTNVVVRFRDAPHGPPTSWVPPYVSPYPNPLSNGNKPPTSL